MSWLIKAQSLKPFIYTCVNLLLTLHRYEELLNTWLNDSSPPVDLQTGMESTDEGTPLRVHIPQWNAGKVVSPAVDVKREDDNKGASGGKNETLSERLEKLKQEIAMERRAEELEEIRLAQLIGL